MDLFLKTAAVQVGVLRPLTLGFSQDRINLKVDYIGHLIIRVDTGQMVIW